MKEFLFIFSLVMVALGISKLLKAVILKVCHKKKNRH